MRGLILLLAATIVGTQPVFAGNDAQPAAALDASDPSAEPIKHRRPEPERPVEVDPAAPVQEQEGVIPSGAPVGGLVARAELVLHRGGFVGGNSRPGRSRSIADKTHVTPVVTGGRGSGLRLGTAFTLQVEPAILDGRTTGS